MADSQSLHLVFSAAGVHDQITEEVRLILTQLDELFDEQLGEKALGDAIAKLRTLEG